MATDTTKIANTAEDLIAHKLQRAGILVAKPKFDQDGADLIALLDVKDAAKFCRIQCKGRSLIGSSDSSVSVPINYATDGFVLFLEIDTGDRAEVDLYCFLGRETRVNEMKKLIIDVGVKGEFNILIHAYIDVTDHPDTCVASATVGPLLPPSC
jgi:hypothetical protein